VIVGFVEALMGTWFQDMGLVQESGMLIGVLGIIIVLIVQIESPVGIGKYGDLRMI